MKAPSSRRIIVAVFLGFISLALPDGMLGVAWPQIRTAYEMPIEALGLLVLFTTAAYLTSSSCSGFLLERTGIAKILTVSNILVSSGLLILVLGDHKSAALFGVVLIGLGSGAIDAGLNSYAAERLSPRMISWLHASFGVGSMISPLFIVGAGAAHLSWRWGYLVVILMEILLAAVFSLSVRGSKGVHDEGRTRSRKVRHRWSQRDRYWLMLGCTAFFLYSGIEVTAGAWAYTVFTESLGVHTTTAGVWISAYWASLTLGRLVLGLVVQRLGSHRIIGTSLIGVVIAAEMLCIPSPVIIPLAGLLLLGFSLSSIYPLFILTTSERMSAERASRAIGYQVAAAGLGIALLPMALGSIAGCLGLRVFGPVLLCASVLLATAYLAFSRAARPRNACLGRRP